MPDVHFVAVIEPTPAFTNMARLLVHSLRVNGGGLADAPVTVVSNGRALTQKQAQALQVFQNVDLEPMPRIAGTPHSNKFNAFYAVRKEYDVLVYLDSDMVVTESLDHIADGIDEDERFFRGLSIGATGAKQVRDYEQMIRRFARPNDGPVQELRDRRFPNGYPLFNTGTMVLTRPAVRAIREDALRISYELHEQYLQETGLPTLFPAFIRTLWNAAWNRLLPYVQSGAGYAHWMTEQLGLALALLKNDVGIEPLDRTYNWTLERSPDGRELPGIYHYMAGLHDIDRSRLFVGEWVEVYANSDSPPKRELARLARSCPQQRELAAS